MIYAVAVSAFVSLTRGATIHPTVLSDLTETGEAPIMIHLASHPELKSVLRMGWEDTQVQGMVSALQSHATDSQNGLLSRIAELGATHVRSFWISNLVACHASPEVIDLLLTLPEVGRISTDKAFRQELEAPDEEQRSSSGVEWNVDYVRAPYLWDMGFTGTGMVHGNADTGVSHVEPALIDHYRGTETEHNFHWYDATQLQVASVDSTSSCARGSVVPCDDNSHGTHTTGTTVGGEGSNSIGVAPGAKWIGCRNMYAGLGSPSTYVGCLQWMVAPTDLQGQNSNASLRPHTIGNSYGCPSDEGCDLHDFDEVLKVVRAAGIFMAVSAGNDGRGGCATVTSPPGLNDDVCSVAASGYQSNSIASYSSRGPITQDGSDRRKPDITAPGSSVRSCVPGGGYSSKSGTSMASPAVAGVVLLLWDALPSLRRDVDATEALLYATATPLYTEEGCGGDTSTTLPNNVFGYGLINAQAAYDAEASHQDALV